MIYTVKQGDHLAAIAAKFGFEDFRTLYNHPDNAALKKKRPDPNVLLPGDALTIPDKRQQWLQASTEKVNGFVLKSRPLNLRLTLLDFKGRPIKEAPVALALGTGKKDLVTDGDGAVETTIPASDPGGTLEVAELSVPLTIGALDPIDEPSGWTARLINLGYILDLLDDDDIALGVEEFQADNGLSVSGKVDDATRAKLRETYGC